MLRRTLLAVLAAALLPAAEPPKLSLDASRLELIPARMKEFVDKGELAGIVTLIAFDGKTVLHNATGWQDLENRKPMSTGSIFQIMSMTKPITGAGIMMLMEEGRLTLNDPVEKHLPEFRNLRMYSGAEPSRKVTIRDVMTHTSGMSSRLPEGLKDLYTLMDRPLSEAVAEFARQPLEFEPGSKWQYSNSGIAVLGRIIEVVSGMPFERFLEQRIFEPLGMTDTFIVPPPDKTDRIARVYTWKDGKLELAGPSILGGDQLRHRRNAKFSAPEFGLFSTAKDLAAFYQMMLNGGTVNGRRFLSRASVDVMTAVQTGDLTPTHNPGTGFGLTWEVVRNQTGALALLSPGTFKHGGAFGTHGWIDPHKNIVGVFLVHRTNDDKRARDVVMQIAGSSIQE